ncbi:hypothetical protein Mycch_5894 (plasmid) [Mycolicibacterium chubuense NBB4]|uniref:Secreted protein n=1 Tax=Mycolicibacterium chubuense (strain NBB4) TaxID=710421 RepID=I4BT96_MYCCN|nr:hypothetical protein Mycch_5894 [Mycolicibacterium chubuense NBB4]
MVASSCSGQHQGHHPGAATPPAPAGVSAAAGAGHVHGGTGHGVLDTQDGFSLQLIQTPTAAGQAGGEVWMRIASTSGAPQTRFQLAQEKLMHVYVVRRDLADFYHLHPDMAADGTWSAPFTVSRPGPYRLATEFAAIDEQSRLHHLVLGTDFEVPGPYTAELPPAPTADSRIDDYDVAVDGDPVAGQPTMLTLRITRNGSPVTDLDLYLGTVAHLTAFHEGDLQVVHMHPQAPPPGAGPRDSAPMVNADFPAKGLYRIFIQFQTDGQLHTAPITVVAQ